ncbi:DUF6934 family protein [Mucilaginibacter sp. OK098]|uniref:DUF6934 family protein n=1 Tax=Mucilaginibacter sp. OK098 TaxID=1855297 RepID=UPI0009150338|nr:hypothetical protein [Mucilaginibacter sp. OK098]SHN30493.1 hypothetical protein SAMN05216524_10940 [Mucilaginibacter sp. OK098]
MNLERYPYLVKNNFHDYEFYSEGPNGRIKKAVRFTKINDEEPIFYNLGFGDVSEKTDAIDDSIVSNNNDRDIVLATVAKTVIDFTNIHGNHYVFATGSTPARTRLNQISISGLFNEISIDFEVLGFKDGNWQPFKKNANYEAFLVKRK